MKGAPELLLELSTYALQDGRHVLVENMRQQLEEQIWGAASAGRQHSFKSIISFLRNYVCALHNITFLSSVGLANFPLQHLLKQIGH